MSHYDDATLARLRQAAEELAFLTGRGYPRAGVEALVSQHRTLTVEERALLERAVLSEADYRARALKEMLPEDIARRPLVVDGHQVIDTVALALAGDVMLETLDQGLAPLSPRMPTAVESEAALVRIFAALREMRPARVKWIFSADRPDAAIVVAALPALAKKHKLTVESEVATDAKAALRAAPAVATSDPEVIAASRSFCNLAAPALEGADGVRRLKLQ